MLILVQNTLEIPVFFIIKTLTNFLKTMYIIGLQKTPESLYYEKTGVSNIFLYQNKLLIPLFVNFLKYPSTLTLISGLLEIQKAVTTL